MKCTKCGTKTVLKHQKGKAHSLFHICPNCGKKFED